MNLRKIGASKLFKIAAGGAGCALTLGIAAAAVAQSSSATDGVIHGCVNTLGVLRLVNAGAVCRENETAISWNQQGPAGAPGSTGLAGPAGPAGSDGAPGLRRLRGRAPVGRPPPRDRLTRTR